MKPIEFEGMNTVYAKDQPPYIPLPTWRDENHAISCWQLEPEEIEEFKRTGVIWLSQLHYGGKLQPQRADVFKPLMLIMDRVSTLTMEDVNKMSLGIRRS